MTEEDTMGRLEHRAICYDDEGSLVCSCEGRLVCCCELRKGLDHRQAELLSRAEERIATARSAPVTTASEWRAQDEIVKAARADRDELLSRADAHRLVNDYVLKSTADILNSMNDVVARR